MITAHKDSKGFTLIELMVTLVVISIGVLALGKFTLTVLMNDNVARQRTVAVHLAEQELENWYSSGTPPNPDDTAVWPKTINGKKYRLKSTGAVTPSGVWTGNQGLQTTDPGVSVASQMRAITIYWDYRGVERSVTVTQMQRSN